MDELIEQIEKFKKMGSWNKVKKRSYSIWVCRPLPGTTVYNFLEDSIQITDSKNCFVLCGTLGEKWVVNEDTLFSTYMLPTGEKIDNKALFGYYSYLEGQHDTILPIIDWLRICTLRGESSPKIYHALCLPEYIEDYPVKTSEGTILIANRKNIDHGNGDYIVCPDDNGQPDFNNVWVVNGLVFCKTYEPFVLPGDRPYGLHHDENNKLIKICQIMNHA